MFARNLAAHNLSEEMILIPQYFQSRIELSQLKCKLKDVPEKSLIRFPGWNMLSEDRCFLDKSLLLLKTKESYCHAHK